MLCQEFEQRVQTLLDERLSLDDDRELTRHYRFCPACREFADACTISLDAVRDMNCPQPPHDLAWRVLAQLEPASIAPRRSPRKLAALVATALATAAGLLIATTLLLARQDRTEVARTTPSDTLRPVAESARPATPGGARATSRAPLPNLAMLPATAAGARLPIEGAAKISQWLVAARTPEKDPYEDLARETGQEVAAVALYVYGIGGGSGEEPAWIVQVSESLKPVTDLFNEALTMLMSALPFADASS